MFYDLSAKHKKTSTCYRKGKTYNKLK